MKRQPTQHAATASVINTRSRQPLNPRAGSSGKTSGTGAHNPIGTPTVAVLNFRNRKALV